MKLSIIIVNYNVKHFLEQCLASVLKSISQPDETEIIVIDNNSSDNSLSFLKPKFPQVKFIASDKNEGFGKANNKALSLCTGEYILFLNPDTLVAEDTLNQCIQFFEQHKQCAAIGVKMIDGKGIYLPESKRGFPSALTSLYKLIGLSRLFPTSKIFNQYALGYLNENEIHEVEVLAGAFIMTRKDILQQYGSFDEDFFMYGEDIDLSYRFIQAGFKNYYLGNIPIIHFKGESTKKGSLNYIKMFYQAMIIFVNKHFSGSKALLFRMFIYVAIWCRAAITLVKQIFKKTTLPFFDFAVVYCTMYATKNIWIDILRDGKSFGTDFVPISIPLYSFVFLIASWLGGFYDNLYKHSKAIIACFWSVIIVLAVYSLMPEQIRYSRGVTLFGGLLSALAIIIIRAILLKVKWIEQIDETSKHYETVVVGKQNEYAEIEKIYAQAGLQDRLLGRIALHENDTDDCISTLPQLNKILRTHSIQEVLFCIGSFSYKQVISIVQTLPKQVSYRFHAFGTTSIVGSDNKSTAGETIAAYSNLALAQPYYLRTKRLTDLLFSLYLLLTLPIHLLLFTKKTIYLIPYLSQVVLGKKTWIGYCTPHPELPLLKAGVFSAYGLPTQMPHPLHPQALHQIDIIYAREYDWWNDLQFIFAKYLQKNINN